MKIAIGCPVRDRAWILPEYLERLEQIEWDDKEYVFLLNDSDDTTIDLLFDFKSRHPDNTTMANVMTYKPPTSDRMNYRSDGFRHLALVRNMFLELAKSTGANFLLSIDSDILVPPYVAKGLVRDVNGGHANICAGAISNVPDVPMYDETTPGNFMCKYDGGYTFPHVFNPHGTHPVDLTGAVYAIPMSVIWDGVRYAPHPNGEDIPFCEQARRYGYRIFVNLDVKCEHRMVRK